jgi:CRISPR-associated protein Csm3
MKPDVAEAEGLAETDSPRKTIANQEYIQIKRGRNAPARLIVRDCHLLPASAELLEKVDTGLYMTEWKFENGIDRVTAAANPRQIERVPAGSEFQFELIYTVEDASQALEDLQNIAIALAILEDDALGGHGSRGYGKVKFQQFQFFYRSLEQYRQITNPSDGGSGLQQITPVDSTSALLDNFKRFQDEIQQQLPPGDNNKT